MTPTDQRRALEEALHDHLGGMVPIAGSKIDLTFRALLDIGTDEAFLAAAMMLIDRGEHRIDLGEGKSGIWTASLRGRGEMRCACLGIGSHDTSPALALLSAIEQARSAERG